MLKRLKAIAKRDRLHKTAIESKDQTQLMEFRKIRNAVNKLIRSTKRRYYSLKVAENFKNSRIQFWATIVKTVLLKR